ncbi:hypothetical protein HAT2_00269 [Candidatus Similichlamydia laticola]|uniref:Uncharacterized protein n=1 Tax=Candidatus Similichlamydia laticola TaxID=2170265 RepID=A0A369KCM2_9BACT|nr:hypothetical protein HAT2_00264 [Candidatus Similichlamydia laticola]RDB31658.1 hypothetical protein HAT2_00269 [Candidatus Similichlamydia laticola]
MEHLCLTLLFDCQNYKKFLTSELSFAGSGGGIYGFNE